MSSMGDNTKSADVSISVESVDDQSSSIPPPKIATTATEPPLFKKSRVSEASTKTQNKSWVWDHYDIVEGLDKKEKKATCKYCGSLISCPSRHGTSSLSNHLHRCKKYPYSNPDKKQKTLEFKSQEGGAGKTIKPYTFDLDSCRKALARMIIIDELPFAHVEKEGFLDFCEVMQPRFIVPSRRTVTRDCHSLFLDEKKKLKEHFKNLPSRICLTTDTWTSIQNLSYMCLTAHFIDHEWNLHKKILNFCPITSHAGEVIGKSVEKCLIEWGISRVLTITVDNASSNDNGILYLKRRFNNWKGTVLNGDYLHMRCAAHVLNLTVREGLKDLDDSIIRIRSAVKYVRSSPARFQRFKSCIEKERIECKRLVCLDVETRWNSTYLMLEAALKFQKAFELLESVDNKYVEELTPKRNIDNGGEHSSRIRGVPTESDWEHARNLLPFLQIFYDSTVKISGSLYVTGNEYMKEIYGIGMMLDELIGSDDIGISRMAGNMKKKYDKYWGNVEKVNILILIAIVLDPRYKLGYVMWAIEDQYDIDKAEILKDKVLLVFNALFDSYSATKARSKVVVTQPVELGKMDFEKIRARGAASFIDARYSKEADSFNSTENKTELDVYLMEMKVDRNCPIFSILDWWKKNSPRFPILASIARDVLAIPISTVASESAFSTGGRILDSFRSSLTPRLVEALICAQDWLRRGLNPIELEESLADLEQIESETSNLTEEQPLVNIED